MAIGAGIRAYASPGRAKGWVRGGLRYSQFLDPRWRGEVSQNCIKSDKTYGDRSGYMCICFPQKGDDLGVRGVTLFAIFGS